MKRLGVWGSFALILLASCAPRDPVLFDDAAWSTKGDPVTWQKLAGYDGLPRGTYRLVDKETGVVVYLVVGWDGVVGVTSQKVSK